MSSITGHQAVIFDNMAYQLSAKLAYALGWIAHVFDDYLVKLPPFYDELNTVFGEFFSDLGLILKQEPDGSARLVVPLAGYQNLDKLLTGLNVFETLADRFDTINFVDVPKKEQLLNTISSLGLDFELESSNGVKFATIDTEEYIEVIISSDALRVADSYFAGAEPTLVSDFSTINAFAVSGEILQALRFFFNEDTQTTYLSPFFDGEKFGLGLDGLSPTDRHSSDLMIATQYFETLSEADKTDISKIGGALFNSLFSTEVSQFVGNGLTTSELFSKIAYSAATGRDAEHTPFGTTALAAMLNDARDAGEVLDGADFNFNLGFSTSGSAIYEALSGGIVQFSGELAESKSTASSMADGFIRSDGDKLISVDFSENFWKSASGKTSYDLADMFGREVVIDRFDFDDYFSASGFDHNVEDAMRELWGSSTTDALERLHFVNTDQLLAGLTLDLGKVDTSYKIDGNLFSSEERKGDVVVGTKFDDQIVGSARNEIIDGGDGSDVLSGGAGDDILVSSSGNADINYINGGSGEDWAVFLRDKNDYSITPLSSSNEYDYVVREYSALYTAELALYYAASVSYQINPFLWLGPEPSKPAPIFTGNTTYIKDVQYGQFDNNIIHYFSGDGPIDTEQEIISDVDGSQVGVISIEAPIYSSNSELEFSLNISTSGIGTQYRVAFILDVSGSMSGERIAQAKAAYVDLINYLNSEGIADVAEFAVIPFSGNSTLYEGLSADEAIAQINSLSAGGGTSFGPAIQRGLEFFDGPKAGVTNIAYFLSDGQGSGASTELQAVADVRAFGIGSGAAIGSLNTIDSNNAVILNSASDLIASFTESEIRSSDVDRIEVFLNGSLAQTIAGDQLADTGATGLSFSGVISGLDLSNADTLEAKVFFQDIAIPVQSVAFEIGDGLDDVSGSEGNDSIAFSLSQRSVDAGGGTDTILGNDLDNIVVKIYGNGVIKTFGGNDTVYAGDNRVSGLDRVIDGGEGEDTVVYAGTKSEYQVSITGGLIKVGTATDTLSNVEFIKFDDVTIRTSDLSELRTISVDPVNVIEGDTNRNINVTIRLDAPATSSVTMNYQTSNGTALVSADYVAVNGNLSFAPGDQEKTIPIELIGDTNFENDENFKISFSNVSGALFSNGNTSSTVQVTITNDDNVTPVSNNDIVSTEFGTSTLIDVLSNDTDANGTLDASAIIVVSAAANGVAVIENGEIKYTPNPDFSGTDTFSYTVQDNEGATSNEATVTVSVTPSTNQAPLAVSLSPDAIPENVNSATVIGALAITDPDAGDTHTLSLIDDAGGLFALDGTNLVVNGNLNFETAASHDITVRATDAAGLSVDQMLTVTVNNLLETFTGGTGDDEIMTGVGGDTINLGSGKDKVLGSVANFFDDQINGFSGDDQLVFVNEAVERQDITVMQGSAILAVDTNDDGSADGSFTLSGNFTAGDFMAVTSSNNTIVTFETFLPELQEGKSLDATLVNGVVNQEFLTGDGSSDFQVTLRDMGFAGYDNTIGVYEIDAGGNIIDTRILFENANSDKSAVAGITDVEAGNSLGFFIVQDAANWAGTLATGDTLSFVNNSGAAANISDGSDISIAVNGKVARQEMIAVFGLGSEVGR